MQADFWNNPLVVSAMRLKYRRSSPGLVTGVYLLALVSFGFALDHYRATITMPLGLVFLVTMFSIQFILSGAIAMFSVSTSMNAEIANRTLDFQRIVSLSPREILLGKMLGEPALSYFLLVATVPFAILCWATGSSDVVSMVWFYINLMTFTLMCSAIGVLNKLSPAAKTAGKQGGAAGWAIFAFAWVPMILINSVRMQPDSWPAIAINLITPIGSLIELTEGNPWQAYVAFWDYRVVSLHLAPLVQLAVTMFAVLAMERRLKNPLDPPCSRKVAYVTLVLLEFAFAGILYSHRVAGISTDQLFFQFGLGHVVLCLVLMMLSAPSRAGLMTWVWRRRDREQGHGAAYLNNRSMINGELAIFCCLGAAVLLVGFVMPVRLNSPAGIGVARWETIVEVLAVSTFLILALGVSYQWCILTGGKGGVMVFFVILLLVSIVPSLIALLFGDSIEEATQMNLLGASPAFYFISHIDVTSKHYPPQYLLASYGLVGAVLYFSLKRWLGRQQKIVSRKLTGMSVL